MITQEQAQAHLKTFETKRLQPTAFSEFSPPYRALGEMIIPEEYGVKRRKHKELDREVKVLFAKDPGFNPWTAEEGQRLAILLFGSLHADRLPAIWELLRKSPYQTGYSRRPFRTLTPDPLAHISTLTGMQQLMQTGFAGIPVADVARYVSYYQWQSGHLAPFFAVVLADKNEGPTFRGVLSDILQGEDEIGRVNRGIITGLLMSEEPENWKLVGQLLLAAQREEGLRQTILESLDQTSIGALRYMTDLILEHKLARFSSVVRAVDVWFGFNWEAPKLSTIERTLRLVQGFLAEPAKVESALRGKDSLEIYVALWSVALRDVDEAILLTTALLWGENRTQKITALYFLTQTGRRHPHILRWLDENFGTDPELDYWARANFPNDGAFSDRLFTGCRQYGQALPKAGKSFPGTVFSWLTTRVTKEYFYDFIILGGTKDHLRQLADDLTDLPSVTRESLLRKIFKRDYTYYLNPAPVAEKTLVNLQADPWKRELIRRAATDRSTGVMATGIRFLGSVALEPADKELIIQLLRRKGKDIRSSLIRVVLGQPEETLREMAGELLAEGNIDQRLAGLEIISVLHAEDRLLSFSLAQAATYRERPKIGKNETVLLDKIQPEVENDLRFDNGFGTVDFASLTPLIVPQLKFGLYQGKPLFADLIDVKKVTAQLQELVGLFQENGSYEYRALQYNDQLETVLLENELSYTDVRAKDLKGREKISLLPLAGTWLDWYDASGLNDFELMWLHDAVANRRREKANDVYASFKKQYFPVLPKSGLPETFWHHGGIRSRVGQLLYILSSELSDRALLLNFQFDTLEDMIARLPEELRGIMEMKNGNHYEFDFWPLQITDWIPGYIASQWGFRHQLLSEEQTRRYYDLHGYLLAAARSLPDKPVTKNLQALHKQIAEAPSPDELAVLRLHKIGTLNDDDLRWQALQDRQLFKLLAGETHARMLAASAKMEVPEEVIAPLRQNLLELELQRGELPTEASAFIGKIPEIPGFSYLFETLERMGKETFRRGYGIYSHDVARQDSFSHIVKVCEPAESDTIEEFSTLAKQLKLPRARWFAVAMYAPQWAPWIAEFLRVPNLELAVWWFHAHASEYMSPLKEKIIAQFSPVAKEDFQQGAIDVGWFYAAYEALGKKNWKLLHDAAKYISEGNGHRQVRTYSAVMLGEIKITATIKRIKEKRDKVYLKALGLIPFSKTNPEADVLRRYNLLQKFGRESRQYGAQRQASERLAVRIGLDNLARNAGYDDTVRFGWIMEAEATNAIMQRSLVLIDKVGIQLFVDADGKADIRVTKDGKSQKSIPAKYSKHKAILELKEHKKSLRQQFSRTRKSLEQAMLNGILFSRDDLRKINLHPVVKPLLEKLVLLAPEAGLTGFWRGDELHDLNGKPQVLDPSDQFTIAHPHHLYQRVEWDLYQRFAFEEQIVQPFKQVFRELYVITADEREKADASARYQGHQIQPRKAAALLRGRGWTISESEGLQKVFHQHDIVATMYAMADWFSPAEVEAPVIEQIVFTNRRGNILQLEGLNPILFSEVMRDIDLVVSVAHVGGVDPEASHSTLQMRGALARESARLFKLENVEVKERHIVVAGKLGRYNVHLGSGVVSKGGLQLSIIPVHGQQRGRLFLPFLDDDPKSAEIISKMRMLARDEETKDPTVLGQLMR